MFKKSFFYPISILRLLHHSFSPSKWTSLVASYRNRIKRSKQLFHSLFFLLLFTGCARVDTDPECAFYEIQEEVEKLTGQNAYWDCSLEESIVQVSVDEILAKELTEDLAVQIALVNNRNLQGVYEELGIAKAQLAQAGLLKNPIFSFAYRFSTQTKVTDLIDGSLLQNFLEIVLIPLKKRMAQAELEATKAVVTTEILDVIAETKIAFYRLLTNEKIGDLKKQILLSTELSYEAAQKLFAAGNLTDLEVSTERSLYEQAKLDVASWEIVILGAREKLNVLMGLWGHQINWRVTKDLPALPIKEEEYKNIENDAIASSIDLKIACKGLLATAAGFGIDTSKLVFPQFDIGVSAEREDGIWYVGPAFNLAIPLFDVGKVNSAKARAKIMQQWNQYSALAIEIRSAARLSRLSLLNAFRQSQYSRQVVIPLAEEVTHLTLLQHNAMRMGIFHLLLAKRDELEKKVQYIYFVQDYWISKITLQTLLNGHIFERHQFEIPVRKHYE